MERSSLNIVGSSSTGGIAGKQKTGAFGLGSPALLAFSLLGD